MNEREKIEKLALNFAPDHLNASGKQVRDGLSAVMRIKNDLWLACDESIGIERLTLQENGSFGKHRSFLLTSLLNLPAHDKVEIDIEGVSFSENYLWLIGSHGLKRKKVNFEKGDDKKQLKRLAKVTSDPNRYIIARIPFEEDPEQEGSLRLVKKRENPQNQGRPFTAAQLTGDEKGNILMDLLREDKHLKDFIPIPGKDNGFDIEGLAVGKEKMLIGLRGPVLRGWAIILEVKFNNSREHSLMFKTYPENKQQYKKYFINLDGLGIRELCIDGEDILILAGPTMELKADMALYRWKGGVNSEDQVIRPENISFLYNIPHKEGFDKAEGIKLFDTKNENKRLIVVYDSPAEERKFNKNSVYADLISVNS